MDSTAKKTLRLAAVLGALALPLAGCATEHEPAHFTGIAPQMEGQRWTELLAALGQPALHPEDRAYRQSWETAYAKTYVDVLERADGSTWMLSDGGRLVALEPGDLDAFHARFDPLDFLNADFHEQGAVCLDECVERFFDFGTDRGYRQLQLNQEGAPIDLAVWEFQQITGARMRTGIFQPEAWWSNAEQRPAGRRWISDHDLAELSLTRAEPAKVRRYRLIRLMPDGAPDVTDVSVNFSEHSRECGTYTDRRGRRIQVIFCSTDEPDQVTVFAEGRLSATPSARRGSWEPFEQALGRAGFSAMAADDAACTGPVAGHAPWVLEALVNGRYRYVQSRGCDDRGLEEAFAAIEALAVAPH